MRRTAIVVLISGCGVFEQGGNTFVTENNFSDKFVARYCEEFAACNGDDCPADDGTSSTLGECDFDQQAARDCLNAEWECNTDFPEFAFPVPDPACNEVCGSATRGTTVTGSGPVPAPG